MAAFYLGECCSHRLQLGFGDSWKQEQTEISLAQMLLWCLPSEKHNFNSLYFSQQESKGKMLCDKPINLLQGTRTWSFLNLNGHPVEIVCKRIVSHLTIHYNVLPQCSNVLKAPSRVGFYFYTLPYAVVKLNAEKIYIVYVGHKDQHSEMFFNCLAEMKKSMVVLANFSPKIFHALPEIDYQIMCEYIQGRGEWLNALDHLKGPTFDSGFGIVWWVRLDGAISIERNVKPAGGSACCATSGTLKTPRQCGGSSTFFYRLVVAEADPGFR
ncbi:hypothetical protein NQ317_009689 [Molorchus minor]|uniref:Uncharacterized protein n=1 Tax=Molorchus minor TaxID=1323400 RepID=A0ABQ9JGX4_9CUCU|nr:hypothetical protein NQ317_009689 [Molorchus minor]